MSVCPVPSRSISTTTFDSFVTRSTRPTLFMPVSVSSTSTSLRHLQERVVLLRRADRDPQPVRDPDVPDQHPALQEGPPRPRGVGEPAEQHEVRITGHHVVARRRQRGDHPIALGPQQRHRPERRVSMPQRRTRRSLCQRREVVRQANELQRVDDGRRRGQVAQAAAREGEGLAHRAADDQLVAVRGQQDHGAGPVGELRVRLVHHDDAGRGVDELRELAGLQRLPGGVVRAGEERHVRCPVGEHRRGGRDVDREVVAPRRRAATRCGCRRR